MNLDEIAARTEIHHVLMTYCRGVDRSDAELLRSIYHEGGTDRHGPFFGTGEEFTTYAVERMAPFATMSQHHITNVYMEIDGDEAAVESYFLAIQPYAPHEGAEEQSLIGGRYLDRFAHRDGRWAIDSREVVMDWTRASIPGPEVSYITQTYPLGARGESDPSAPLFST